jgi:hypothetical protein
MENSKLLKTSLFIYTDSYSVTKQTHMLNSLILINVELFCFKANACDEAPVS